MTASVLAWGQRRFFSRQAFQSATSLLYDYDLALFIALDIIVLIIDIFLLFCLHVECLRNVERNFIGVKEIPSQHK